MVKQSLPLFFQVAVRFTQMPDKIQPIWSWGNKREKKYIGLALAEPVPPWHSTGGWNKTARDGNRHWGPNMKELRPQRLYKLFFRPWLPVKQLFPAQLWTNINMTRSRNSWDWHFMAQPKPSNPTEPPVKQGMFHSSRGLWFKGFLYPAVFSNNHTYVVGILSSQLWCTPLFQHPQLNLK